MANRRMLSKELLESDNYMDMTEEARLLFVYMMVFADDDGFIPSLRSVCRTASVDKRFIDELLEAGFLLPVGDIHVIPMWLKENQIPATKHSKEIRPELSLLGVDGNKMYYLKGSMQNVGNFPTDSMQNVGNFPTDSMQNVGNPHSASMGNDSQYSIDKSSIDKSSTEQTRLEQIRLDKDKSVYVSEGESQRGNDNPDLIGKHNNVDISQYEYNELVREYGKDNTDGAVNRLSDHINDVGNDINDHYTTINNILRARKLG